MFTSINEAIEVVGIFTKGKFIPKKFKWQQRIIPITQITLTSDIKDAGIKKRLYSVLNQQTLYRLEFNRESEHWTLLEVWSE